MSFLQPNKRIILCREVYLLIAALPLAVLAIFLFYVPLIPLWVTIVIAITLANGTVFLLGFYLPIWYRQARYILADDGLTTISGVFFRTQRFIPLSAIRHITVLCGPLEKRLGLTTAIITATGGRVWLDGIPSAKTAAIINAVS